MYLLKLIDTHFEEFINLCQEHRVDKIYAFGSSITSHFDPLISDIDIIVTIGIDDPADRGEALLSFWDKLEVLFSKKVDLLTEDSILNPYLRKNIDSTKRLIYDRERKEVLI